MRVAARFHPVLTWLESDGSAVRLDEEIGVTYRQLDFWARKGYVEADASGSGYARTFSDSEKEVAKLMGRLVRVGFTPKYASVWARTLLKRNNGGVTTVLLGPGLKLQTLFHHRPEESGPDSHMGSLGSSIELDYK